MMKGGTWLREHHQETDLPVKTETGLASRPELRASPAYKMAYVESKGLNLY